LWRLLYKLTIYCKR